MGERRPANDPGGLQQARNNKSHLHTENVLNLNIITRSIRMALILRISHRLGALDGFGQLGALKIVNSFVGHVGVEPNF
jgi:hypothetical protein